MIKALSQSYIGAFKGLSREIWLLTAITFINRAGTMVVPFLSKYLKEDLDFSYSQVGWVMVFFGIGSFLGSWLGGKLADKIGFYKVMIFSLIANGVLFIALQYVKTFELFCIAILVIITIADMFRPAMFVSLKAYSQTHNRTRSLTLVRLAVNLGFSIGPALAGLIIVGIGYGGLFWIDGATCIIAALLFMWWVKDKHALHDAANPDEPVAPLAPKKFDTPYFVFLGIIIAMGMMFFQLFSTMPLYHKEVHKLTELDTGLLLSLNGLLIFLLEMPMVNYIERQNYNHIKLIMLSLLMFSASLLVLLITPWAGWLVVSIIIITFAEMFSFPFGNAFAMSRAPKGQEGKYMAYYSMAFSVAHILGAKAGMEIVGVSSYDMNWFVMGLLGLVAFFVAFWLKKQLDVEANRT
jgi:predicted MFS family arabinose efflux permease